MKDFVKRFRIKVSDKNKVCDTKHNKLSGDIICLSVQSWSLFFIRTIQLITEILIC